MKPKKTIGEVIAAARLKAGLTRQQVAESSGLSLGYLRDLENDRFASLSLRTVANLKGVMTSLSIAALMDPAPPEGRTTPRPKAGRPRKQVKK
jgi:transcriptional regulator with XRE-family HTH domain